MINITVKIGGEAGFGIMTTGLFLGKIASRSGYHVFEYPEYPSLIRGDHNIVKVRMCDEKIHSQEDKTDILICLNLDTYKRHINNLKGSGMVIYDEDSVNLKELKVQDKNISYVNIPFSKIIKENDLAKVVMNNIALGALLGVLDADINILNDLIVETFARKSEKIVEENKKAVKLGYDHAKKVSDGGYRKKLKKRDKIIPRMYMNGNEMVSLGTIAAGCKFYVAYPMTPASGILHYLASKAEKAGMVVKHAEDEISVVNMALGGSFAGVRSMIATSGGGFALMVESIALSGITETPLVVAMIQRPGPATGMPTWTEQGDLLFIINAGHGEFPKIVLTPGDLEETYKLTIKAFNMAEKYQTPVFIMGDKYLMESHQTVDKSKITGYKFEIQRGKLLGEEELSKIKDYKRYKITEDGISPRALPGQKGGLHQANSYEHLEDGHTTEDAHERIKQVDKRNKKAKTYLKEDFDSPQLYGDKDAPVTVVSWGSSKAPILQALSQTESKFNYLHFTHIWPLSEEKVANALNSAKKLLLVENNSTAQLGKLLRMTTGVKIKNRLLKYSGRPVNPKEVVKKVEKL